MSQTTPKLPKKRLVVQKKVETTKDENVNGTPKRTRSNETPLKRTKKQASLQQDQESPKTVLRYQIPIQTPMEAAKPAEEKTMVTRRGRSKKSDDTLNSLNVDKKTVSEVVRHQFPNQKSFQTEDAVTNKETSIEPAKVVNKRGRAKKHEVTIDSSNVEQTDSQEISLNQKNKCVKKAPVKLIRRKQQLQTKEIADSPTIDVNLEKKSVKKAKTDLQKVQKIKPTQSKSRILRKFRGKKSSVNNTSVSEPTAVVQHKDDAYVDNITDKLKQSKTLVLPRKRAGAIKSRKASLNSNSDCLSWTKDISSSSTTTCVTVCSTDIVRIDNKLPILKLPPVDYQMNEIKANRRDDLSSSSSSASSSSSDSFSDECSKCESGGQVLNIDSHSVNLSTSSISQIKPSQESLHINKTDSVSKLSKALDKLTSNLKKIDLEILNWIGYQNEDMDVDAVKTQERMFRILKEESAVVMHCKNIKRVLSDDNGEIPTFDETEAFENRAHDKNNFVKPSNISVTKSIVPLKNTNTSGTYKDIDHNKDKETLQNETKIIEDNSTTDNTHVSFDHSYDDDDALSLFAESITGIESSRLTNSIGSPPSHTNCASVEEYIPQPVRNQCSETEQLVYCPTKISDNERSDSNVKTKIICEKQNADSTSIYRESSLDRTIKTPSTEILDKTNLDKKCLSPNITNVVPREKSGSYLMSSIYKPSQAVKSVVFKGICFFHLISSCRHNALCRFPHVVPNPRDIKVMLHKLSEEIFIQEYMLMRNWPGLRRLYGLCFVEECARRELTSFLVEMAMDFVMKMNSTSREDSLLKIDVIEYTLLHLNTVDLNICDNLLKLTVQQDTLLCDVFMETIAATQNFSRFKLVFLNLTNFITKNNRTFSLNVATQILERVCILPYEESLVKALLNIIKHTDSAIFENTMMAKFEHQLSVTNRDLYDQFAKIKRGNVSRPVLGNLYASSPIRIREVEPTNVAMYPERQKRYTSPDTTHLDNLNKTDEPIIKRTINFDLSRSVSVNTHYKNSTQSNEGFEESRPQTNHYKNWQNNRVYDNMRSFNSHVPVRQAMKRPTINRQVTYGGSPSKFPRRSGPEFF
ncbi:uncharacterized protein LOC131845506 isoform X2 [Achroia grisella]|uniref:uncharacterized protein LOC131845506 isoform X2 n=1 Tax=Achroia grisella TaxID=688607 RepID=UPI0027D314A4|nr:uncharacterized protein LOC131845506 isoform X2 [Achroia grisella]